MTNNIRWGAALGGALLAEVALIASSFVWVAIYSFLINPGQPFAVYEAHAQASGPWVSIVAGLPLFYAIGRWIARNRPTALVLWGIMVFGDAAILALIAGTAQALPLALIAASYSTKLLACILGSRHAAARSVTGQI
jgi:hypothetical protein